MSIGILADFKTEPFEHQLREFETHAEEKARALLWQMRTGKSKVIIDTACHLALKGEIDAVLVLAPNGVHQNWISRELKSHHWDTVPYQQTFWSSERFGDLSKGTHEFKDWWAKTKDMLWGDKLAWFSFNSESMTRPDVRRVVKRIVNRRKVLIVFDESDDFRSPGSKRSKMARAIAKKCAYRRILTGTVVENSPLAAFSQYELLKPGALGFTSYSPFKDRYAEYELMSTRRGQKYPKLVGYRNLEELRYNMSQWSSVLLREDCHDMPALVHSTRKIDLTPQQVKLYKELHHQFTVDIKGERVSVGENTNRIMKLQQIVNGFLIDEFRDVFTIPGGNPRLDAISDEVFLSPGKVIIWCQFHEDMDRVVERLESDGHKVDQYHGRVSDKDREKVRKNFQPGAKNDIKAIVGHPQSGGRGLDLSAASKIIWYSHTFNAITRKQADERATAIGGNNIPVVDFVAPGVDEYILGNVSKKVDVADDLAGRGMKKILKSLEI